MKKIAVIGSGIAGLASAWILSQKHEVILYEKNDYVGGHTNTRPATFGDKTVFADTGFMVFNNKTYPNIIRMFEHLGVESYKTDMAFGITVGRGNFEFSSDSVFLQRSNIVKPVYWKMLVDILHFNRNAQDMVAKHDVEFPLSALLKELGVGDMFREKYLLPMAGAIWSTDKNNILEYPAKQFVSFFDNHGLLSPKSMNPFKIDEERLQWYTVKNGSQEYVQRILSQMKAKVRVSCGVTTVRREGDIVEVCDEGGETIQYNDVVFASHPNQTLRMLSDADSEEVSILEKFVYTRNVTYMHKDPSYMLKATEKWPSWTYAEPKKGDTELSYYMNRLQDIGKDTPVFVTLNPSTAPNDAEVFYTTEYEHPQFSVDTAHAQRLLRNIQGVRNTWYAGAWCGNGFHEDGLNSALEIAKRMDISAPWA